MLRANNQRMRPEILNPLFAEVEALKGVGPQVAKLLKRLDLDAGRRPALSSADRRDRAGARAGRERRAARPQRHPRADAVRDPRKPLGPRADARVRADGDGNTISLIYFNNPGWAKRSLPMGEKRIVSGKLEAYGDEWQIIHPEVAEPGKGPQPAIREPVYPLTEGLTNRRLGELAREALERAPELPEWIEPSLRGARRLARRGARRWREAHREPGADDARRRLAYDEIFANQLALLLLRQSQRRHRTVPLAGHGRADRQAQAALPADRRAAARDRGNPRRHGAVRADAAPAPGRRRLGQDAGRAAGDADRGRIRRAGGAARPDRNPRPPASCDLARPARQHRRARRDPHRPREGPGARQRADGPRRRLDRHPRRHPRDLPGEGRLQEPRPRGDRRAAPLRRVAAAAARVQGRASAAPAGDDRDADPAHADAHPIWRDGRQPDRRDAAGPDAGRNARDQRGEAARRDRRPRPPHRRRRPGLLGVPAGRGEREERRRRGRGARARAQAALRRGQGRAGPRPHEGAGQGCGDGALRLAASSPCWSRRR